MSGAIISTVPDIQALTARPAVQGQYRVLFWPRFIYMTTKVRKVFTF